MPMQPTSGNDYTPCPTGTHRAIVTQAIELGMQPGYQGAADKPQLYLAFELPDTLRDDGKPFVLGKRYTISLYERANLVEVAEALLGATPTQYEPEKFLRKACLVNVGHKSREGGGTTAVIKSVVALPGSDSAPHPVGEVLYYDWAAPDLEVLDKLPEWLHKVVAQGKDQPVKAPPAPVAAEADDFEDKDLPF